VGFLMSAQEAVKKIIHLNLREARKANALELSPRSARGANLIGLSVLMVSRLLLYRNTWMRRLML
jgi:hypothetical protein